MERPSIYRRLIHWLSRLLGPRTPASRPRSEVPAATGELSRIKPQPVTMKVSLIIFNPSIPREGRRKLTEVLGWNDPDRLAAELIADLREVSHGYANYKIVERIEVDEFPVKEDGYRYSADEFLRCWRARRGFHQPDAVDYHAILAQHDLIRKVQTGQVDEVWTISFPYAGFYESRMAGPGAFWCNAPPLPRTDAAGRRFVIMAFNYERSVGEMLESYGHRAESILAEVFRSVPEPQNLWKRFTLFDKIAPGQAEVGNIHFAPNSRQDYDWGNAAPVSTRSRTWANFPDLDGRPIQANAREWGSGDIRAHHRWWFSLLPHVSGSGGAGQPTHISNNWWEYIVNPNLARRA